MRVGLMLCLLVLVGCAGIDGGAKAAGSRYEPFVGRYQGSFASALTEEPEDDLNFNPCDPRITDCVVHHDPLVDIVLDLSLAPDGQLRATFYRSREALAVGQPLDLLGRGCGTRIGSLASFTPGSGADERSWTAVFPLTVENRLCLGRLRPTSTHAIELTYVEDVAEAARYIEVAVDKAVINENYLYVKEDGIERRVRMDLAGKVGERGETRYRVCIENDLGEFDRCVLTDKKLKQFFLPVPLPGGVAANYTWWHSLYPNLKRTRGLYSLEQYTGRFDRAED